MFSNQKATRRAMAGIGLAAVVGISAAAILDSTGGATSAAASGTTGTASVRSQVVRVEGRSEPILVDQQGMPLYYYTGDTTTVSRVSGDLARLWPPLTAATVTGPGLAGKLANVADGHGQQIAYNGHLLYTFISDRSGVVTGQGVQNFYVATPTLATQAAASVPSVATNGY